MKSIVRNRVQWAFGPRTVRPVVSTTRRVTASDRERLRIIVRRVFRLSSKASAAVLSFTKRGGLNCGVATVWANERYVRNRLVFAEQRRFMANVAAPRLHDAERTSLEHDLASLRTPIPPGRKYASAAASPYNGSRTPRSAGARGPLTRSRR
jgi:hypothetical protein